MFGRSKDKKSKRDESKASAPEPTPRAPDAPTEPVIAEPADEGGSIAPMMRSTDRIPDPNDPAPASTPEVRPAPAPEAVIELEPEAPVSETPAEEAPVKEEPTGPSEDSVNAAADAASMIERIQHELAELKDAEEQREEAVRLHADRERAFHDQVEALRAELEAERSQRTEQEHDGSAAASRIAELEACVEELRSDAAAASERAEQLQRERDEASAIASGSTEARQREHEELERLRHERHEACERAEALQRELEAARSQPAPDSAPNDELVAEMAQLQNALTEFESRMQTAESNAEQLSQELANAHERASIAETNVQELSAECVSMAQRVESSTDHGPALNDFNATRRERLGRVRVALTTRTAQLYKVKQALEQKARELKDASEIRRQAEQTLFETKERKAQIERAYTGIMSLRAKGAAGLFTGCVFAAWIALCIGAWFGTSKVVPLEYDAQATFGADVRGLDAPDERGASWNEFAAALPQDPMFLERTAQRMKTRSYEDLDSPSELGAFLEERAIFEATAPGELTVSLRATGRDRSERLLEMLSTSIVAYANETRTRRADGAPTAIVTAASAAAVPADDPRLAIAGAVAGGLTALLLIAAIGAWRALRKTVIDSGREAMADLDAHAAPAYEPSEVRAPIDAIRPMGAHENDA